MPAGVLPRMRILALLLWKAFASPADETSAYALLGRAPPRRCNGIETDLAGQVRFSAEGDLGMSCPCSQCLKLMINLLSTRHFFGASIVSSRKSSMFKTVWMYVTLGYI